MRLINNELNDKVMNVSKCITCPHCKKSIQMNVDYESDKEPDESDESDKEPDESDESSENINNDNEIDDKDENTRRIAPESDSDIQEMANYLMDYLYTDFIDIMMEYNYQDKWKQMVEFTFDEIQSIDDSIFGTDNNTFVEYKEEITEMLMEHIQGYLIERQNPHIPYMLYNSNELDSVKMKLERIDKKNESIPEQRTEGWYDMRHNMISASSLWKCLHTEGARKQIIKEKCEPVKKFFSVNMESPLHWGQKYEPLAQAYYEYKYKTQIKEYGCIQHDKYPFLGASPDGVNIDETSPLYGRMLEIKCIVNREITGIPKKEYWIQMQSQMECCNLDSCDFLECRFKEYDSYAMFVDDEGEAFFLNKSGKLRGSYLCFANKNGQPFYEYPPIDMKSKEEYEIWEQGMMDKHSKYTWLKTIRWYLEYVSCVTTKRNIEWFERMFPKIKKVWNHIEKERESKRMNDDSSSVSENNSNHKKKEFTKENIKKIETIKSKTKPNPQVFLFDIDTSDL